MTFRSGDVAAEGDHERAQICDGFYLEASDAAYILFGERNPLTDTDIQTYKPTHDWRRLPVGSLPLTQAHACTVGGLETVPCGVFYCVQVLGKTQISWSTSRTTSSFPVMAERKSGFQDKSKLGCKLIRAEMLLTESKCIAL